ncbi:MAG: PilW family protein, partial [Halioglobus sp.]|nr:PilW family protein [Halioglobus sp.]
MTRATTTRPRESGFSLVELMVGLTLGLLLIAGAISIYLATRQSYTEVEQVAALTENARFAEQIVGESLRHMGFLGEVTANKVEVDSGLVAPSDDCNDPAGAYDLDRLGYAATVDSSGDALGCITDGLEGTDVLVIKRALTQPFSSGPRERDPNDPPSGAIDTPHALESGRTYVMTNNVSGLLFNGATPPTITTGGEIPGGTAWEYQYEVFYVRQENPADVPMLSRRVLSYNPTTDVMEFTTEDLAEGVENLQLLFGYDGDSDGEVDTYKDLAAIEAAGNWQGVQSVEVFMLVRSATGDA